MNIKEVIIDMLNNPTLAWYFKKDFENYLEMRRMGNIEIKEKVLKANYFMEREFERWLGVNCVSYRLESYVKALDYDGIDTDVVCTLSEKIRWGMRSENFFKSGSGDRLDEEDEEGEEFDSFTPGLNVYVFGEDNEYFGEDMVIAKCRYNDLHENRVGRFPNTDYLSFSS